MHPKSGEGWTRYLEILINNHTLDMTGIIFNVCNELEIEFELYAFKYWIKIEFDVTFHFMHFYGH